MLKRFDVRVSVVYAIGTVLWLLVSNMLFAGRGLGPTFRLLQTIGFLVITTLALFIITSRERARLERALRSDLDKRKQTDEALNVKFEEDRLFQKYLKELHEISIELTQVDGLDDFYKRAVQLGVERLGFDRLSIILYDDASSTARGTYGIDHQGNLTDEHQVQFIPSPKGVMSRAFHQDNRFCIDEDVELYTSQELTGRGWNAASVLWNGTQGLGWLVADNGIQHKPVSKPLLDTLALYSLTVGTLLARKQIEADLRESEARYRILADNVTDLITRTEVPGKVSYVSPSIRTMLGYEPEDMLGKSGFELIHPDDWVAVKATAGRRLDPNDPPPVLTYRVRHKDGHYIWLENVSHVIQSDRADGRQEFINSSRDITQRRQVEEALRESETQLRESRQMLQTILDTIPVAVFWKNRDSVYQGCNRMFARNAGVASTAEIVGKRDADLPWAREETAEYVLDDQVIMTGGITRLGREQWKTIVNGVRIATQANKQPMLDSQGNVIGVLGMYVDISELKQAENKFREQRDFLQLVIDNVPDLIMVKDQTGHFQLANNRAAQDYGVTPEEMIGKTTADLNPNPDEVTFITQKDQETLETRQPIFISEQMVVERYYQTNKIPLRNLEGSYDRLLIVSSDITEHKKAEVALRQAFEKERELGELKSRFVSMASHEFRTPLATILATTETLSAYRQKMADTQIDERLGKIREQVEHLQSIMEDVLQLARIQERRIEFNPVKVDLDAICRSILDEFQSHPNAAHDLQYSYDHSLPPVKLDKRLMRQILTNLISNAIKYSPDGKIVSVRLLNETGSLVIEVQDQGIGIPEADLKHLFEPFHRAANVGAISGTGLGLSIARESVELHGGTIGVKSQVGVGTTISVRIPFESGRGHDENSSN